LAEIGDFEGFHPDATRYMGELLDDHTATFRPRGKVEDDPTFLQVIPYVLCRFNGDIFGYSRGTDGGENRLASRWSIGVGGHINDGDMVGCDGWNPRWVYGRGLWRELREELGYEPRGTISRFGVIFDQSDKVGCVHIGFCHILELAEPIHWPAAYFRTECRMAPPDRWEPGVLEGWSRIALQALLAEPAAHREASP
jgi:predicted NUDIX family phosphoesterase